MADNSSRASAGRRQAHGAGRDHRIDWLRGLALVTIFINHMPFNRLGLLTTRNLGFSDASELFALLAGVGAALAFFPRFERGERMGVAVKAVRRAGVLYGAHLAATLAAVALFCAAYWLIGEPRILDAIGVRQVLEQPMEAVRDLAIGNRQLIYFNILPMYIVFMVMLPALLWLAVRDLRLMLAASAALYLASHLLPLDAPNYHTNSGWYFNPASWQLIYSVGLALGVLRLRGQTVPWHPLAGALAAAYAVFALVWVLGGMGERVSHDMLPEWIDGLTKGKLPLARLAHMLALAYLLVHSPLWTRLARLPASNLLAAMGRNSLPVFVLGSLLSMAGWIVLAFAPRMLALECVLTVAGVAAMAGLAAGLEAGMIGRLRGVAARAVGNIGPTAWFGSKAPALRTGTA